MCKFFFQESEPTNTKKAKNVSKKMLTDYMRECHSGEFRSFGEMPAVDVNNYLEGFFISVKTQKGEEYNASSLRTIHGNISRYFQQTFNIDIKSGPEFKAIRMILKRKQEESVREGKAPGKNKSRPVPEGDLKTLIDKGLMNYHTPTGLTTLLIVKLQTNFGLRGGKELHNIQLGDLKFGEPDDNTNLPAYVELQPRLTKTRRELHPGFDSNSRPKLFPYLKTPELCPVRGLLKYIDLRPASMKDDPNSALFLGVNHKLKNEEEASKSTNWFLAQNMGLNTISKLLKRQLQAGGC